DLLERGTEDELAGVQHERLGGAGVDQAGEVRLVLGRIDHRVAVVVEEPEVPIQPDVDAGRLDHLRLVRVQPHAAGVDLGADVTVGEQHGPILPPGGGARGRVARAERHTGGRALLERLPRSATGVAVGGSLAAGRVGYSGRALPRFGAVRV